MSKLTNAELYHNYAIAKQRLEKAKVEELRWRMLIALKLFPNFVIGTNYSSDGLCKMIAKETATIIDDKNLVLKTLLNIEAPTGETIYWKHHVSLPEFLKLPTEIQSALSSIVTIKPATPTIELVTK